MASYEKTNITIGELARKRRARLDAHHLTAPTVSAGIEQTNINHYRTKTGHGHAAEDANALNDRLSGRKVEVTGKSQELNGADRIVDGVKIQTKYCQSAKESVDAAFKNGEYRYPDQVLEVPKDQYEQAVELMRQKIKDGQVPGVDDPAQAEALVKEGSVTYQQAVNIAKAGNIDSIWYDVKSRAVSTSFAFTLSFAITFATLKAQGVDTKVALRTSLIAGLKVGGVSLLSGVITAQLLRTQLVGGVGKIIAKNMVDTMFKTELGKRFIIRYASAATGQPMGAFAARNYAAKALRTNVVSGAVVTLVMTSPDIYRAAVQKNVSWPQVSKNLLVNASGVIGGLAGAAGGAAGGAALGTMIMPGVGTTVGATVGGVMGGLGVGMGAGSLSKVLMDYLIVDDAKEMVDLLEDLLAPLVFDYMLSEAEVEQFLKGVGPLITPAFLRDMYQASDRPGFVYQSFEPLCEGLARQRPKVELPCQEQIFEAEAEFAAELEQFELDQARVQLIVALRECAEIPLIAVPADGVESSSEALENKATGQAAIGGSSPTRRNNSWVDSKWYRFGQ